MNTSNTSNTSHHFQHPPKIFYAPPHQEEKWMYQSRAPPKSLSNLCIPPEKEPRVLSFYYPTTVINTDLDLKDAPDFYPTADTAEVQGYQSQDPRLFDTLRNNHLVLDKPAQQPASVQPLCIPSLEDMKKMPYAGVYPDYQSLTGGNYQYYTSPFLSDAYAEPVYQIPSMVKGVVFQDPMGSLKPYYDRQPIMRENSQLSEYSFDRDQMSFREDIIANQSSLMNRKDFQIFSKYISKKKR